MRTTTVRGYLHLLAYLLATALLLFASSAKAQDAAGGAPPNEIHHETAAEAAAGAEEHHHHHEQQQQEQHVEQQQHHHHRHEEEVHHQQREVDVDAICEERLRKELGETYHPRLEEANERATAAENARVEAERSLSSSMDTLQKQFTEATQNLIECQSEGRASVEREESLDREVTRSKECIDGLEGDLRSIERERDALEARLAESEERNREEREAADVALEETKSNLLRKSDDLLDRERKAKDEIAARVDELESDLSEARRRAQATKDEVFRLQKELYDAHETVRELEERANWFQNYYKAGKEKLFVVAGHVNEATMPLQVALEPVTTRAKPVLRAAAGYWNLALVHVRPFVGMVALLLQELWNELPYMIQEAVDFWRPRIIEFIATVDKVTAGPRAQMYTKALELWERAKVISKEQYDKFMVATAKPRGQVMNVTFTYYEQFMNATRVPRSRAMSAITPVYLEAKDIVVPLWERVPWEDIRALPGRAHRTLVDGLDWASDVLIDYCKLQNKGKKKGKGGPAVPPFVLSTLQAINDHCERIVLYAEYLLAFYLVYSFLFRRSTKKPKLKGGKKLGGGGGGGGKSVQFVDGKKKVKVEPTNNNHNHTKKAATVQPNNNKGVPMRKTGKKQKKQ